MVGSSCQFYIAEIWTMSSRRFYNELHEYIDFLKYIQLFYTGILDFQQ
jgi:hypothetical protein